MNEAIDRIREAALANDAQAQWDLAVCYAQGNGVEQSDAKAFEWICRAAENGNEEAEKYVISAYENGKEELGIQPDLDKLVEWADKLSENGSAAMRIKYAQLYYNETTHGKIDIFKAYDRVAELADKGNIPCAFYAYMLGALIAEVKVENGIYDCSHLERVINYMKILDGTDHPISEKDKASVWYKYGLSLMNQNKNAESMNWFKLAIPYSANAEMLYASFSIHQASTQGANSPLWAEAYKHAKHAVERNDCEKKKEFEMVTCGALAKMTRNGFGTTIDIDASYHWAVRAAELGDEDAKRDLPRYRKKLFGGYTFK